MDDFDFGNDDFDWDDDFGNKEERVPDDYVASGAEEFSAFLSLKRDEDREIQKKLVEAAKHEKVAAHSPSIIKSPTELKQSKTTFNETQRKERKSIMETYKKYMEHERKKVVKARMQEIKDLGMPIIAQEKGFKSKSPKLGFGGEKFTSKRLRTNPLIQSTPEGQLKTYGSVMSLADILDDKNISFSTISSGSFDSLRQEDFNDLTITGHEENEKDKEEIEHKKKVAQLVSDTYYPGVIDDAVNKKVNYYHLYMDLSFSDEENIPDHEPEHMLPTLIEAFEMRFDLETEQRKNDTANRIEDPERSRPPDFLMDDKNFIDYLRKYDGEKIVNRDEVHVANAVEFDLLSVVRNRPDTELIKAINSLFKAQVMNDFDKFQQAAEEAFSTAPPEYAETAAVQRAEKFKPVGHESRKTHYNPIEIVSYMGITKPGTDDDGKPTIQMEFSKTKI